ncbi:hypothetical protein TNCV_5083841 [Trichonephila clavipes]|nr:hypothetical protein TNCV_5083841 [Trichonephila clavipes]
MDSLSYSSFSPTALGQQGDEEATPGIRPLQFLIMFTQENTCSHEYVDPKIVRTSKMPTSSSHCSNLEDYLFHASNISASTCGTSFKAINFCSVMYIHFWTSKSSNLLFNSVNFPLHKALLFKTINCIFRDPVSIPNGSMGISLLFVLR